MVYDVARRRIVLFGGRIAGTQPSSDTWEWDGNNWTLQTPATSPPVTASPAMAYDSARQRVVMAGGGVWEYDGSSWFQRSQSGGGASGAHTMAYDEARQRCTAYSYGSTWDWDGQSWTKLTTPMIPTSASPFNYSAVYDPVRGCLLLYGFISETWLLGPTVRPSVQQLGLGCSGSAGVPRLVSTDPYLANLDYTLDTISARASSLCYFGLSPTSATTPVGGGCTLYLGDLNILLPTTTNIAGVASVHLVLPIAASLRGAALYAQSFVADPQGPVFGLAFTAGAAIVLGD